MPLHPEQVEPSRPPVAPKWAQWLARQFDKGPNSLKFGVAHTEDGLEGVFAELEKALRLVHRVYVKKQYITPRPSELHLNLYLLLPRSRTFVVKEGDRVIATLSVVLDSPLGLPIDKLYPEAMRELRKTTAMPDEQTMMLSQFFWDSANLEQLSNFQRGSGSRIAELTAFALDDQHQSNRASAASISLELMRMAYKYSVMAGVNSYVIEVTPSHAAFYERFWGFKAFTSGRAFPVDGAPAVAMESSPVAMTKVFAEAEKSAGGMHPLLLLKKCEHAVIASAMRVPILSPAALRYFLEIRFHQEELPLWMQASPLEREAFKKAYDEFGYDLSWTDHPAAEPAHLH